MLDYPCKIAKRSAYAFNNKFEENSYLAQARRLRQISHLEYAYSKLRTKLV